MTKGVKGNNPKNRRQKWTNSHLLTFVQMFQLHEKKRDEIREVAIRRADRQIAERGRIDRVMGELLFELGVNVVGMPFVESRKTTRVR